MPKRVKYRKQMRGRMRGMDHRGSDIHFGEYGLQAMQSGWITQRQIEAARRAMVRALKRRGKVWIRIFPDKPVTQRAAETRMGKGKGAPEDWVSVTKPGRIIYEIDGVNEEQAKEAFKACSHKLPVKTKLVMRRDL